MEMIDLNLESMLEIDPAAPQTLANHTFNSLRSPAPRARNQLLAPSHAAQMGNNNLQSPRYWFGCSTTSGPVLEATHRESTRSFEAMRL